jgi:hypothetical protein
MPAQFSAPSGALALKLATFSARLIKVMLDAIWVFFEGLLRGLASCEQKEAHAAADKGQAGDNQCDA